MTEQLPNKTKVTDSDEIDLRELFSAIWAGKWTIIIITAIFSIASVFYAISLPNIYKSEALLSPVSTEAGLRLPSQLGGLAALAGVNISSGSADKTDFAVEVLKSRDFVGRFIEKYDLFVPIMAANGWDPSSDALIIDPDIYNTETNQWVREVKPPFQSKPSLQESYKVFIRLLNVSQDKNTGMVKLSIEYFSPFLAKQWVDKLIIEINEDMRERDLTDAKLSIEYLNEQIGKTNLADARSMLFSLIEEQTKTVMLANVSDEYVFKTVDQALVPELKERPKRILIVIFSFVLSALLSIFLVLALKVFRK